MEMATGGQQMLGTSSGAVAFRAQLGPGPEAACPWMWPRGQGHILGVDREGLRPEVGLHLLGRAWH